jgi:hypothetical protein
LTAAPAASTARLAASLIAMLAAWLIVCALATVASAAPDATVVDDGTASGQPADTGGGDAPPQGASDGSTSEGSTASGADQAATAEAPTEPPAATPATDGQGDPGTGSAVPAADPPAEAGGSGGPVGSSDTPSQSEATGPREQGSQGGDGSAGATQGPGLPAQPGSSGAVQYPAGTDPATGWPIGFSPVALGGGVLSASGGVLAGGILAVNGIGCGLGACYGRAALGGLAGLSLDGARAKNRAEAQARAAGNLAEASALPWSIVPGGPGFSSLFGGGGGGVATVMLFGFLAVLGAALRLALDGTAPLRIPAVTWRPSAYIPPIESPG